MYKNYILKSSKQFNWSIPYWRRPCVGILNWWKMVSIHKGPAMRTCRPSLLLTRTLQHMHSEKNTVVETREPSRLSSPASQMFIEEVFGLTRGKACRSALLGLCEWKPSFISWVFSHMASKSEFWCFCSLISIAYNQCPHQGPILRLPCGQWGIPENYRSTNHMYSVRTLIQL